MRLRILTSILLASVIGACIASSASVAQNQDNFVISQYDVQLELGVDSEQRSVLKTVETITADFPPNQNRGLLRQFVEEYDGHPTSLRLQSVTDEAGNALPYSFRDGELRIGSEDVFVEGRNTYVLTYTQRDVTRQYEDTGKDEFYWDVIGVDWRVPINGSTVALRIDESITDAIETDLQCYRGAAGEKQDCIDAYSPEKGNYALLIGSLGPKEGATISLGFKEGTFSPYRQSWWQTALMGWLLVQGVVTIGGVIVGVILCYKAYIRASRRKEIGTVVPEYLPPPSASITTAAAVGTKYGGLVKGSVMAAQLLDLAVRRYIKLYEVREGSFWKTAEYEIEIQKEVGALREEERELLEDMYGRTPVVGDRLNMKKLKNDTAFYRRTLDNDKKQKLLMNGAYGLYEKNTLYQAKIVQWSKRVLIVAIFLLSPSLLVIAGVVYTLKYLSVLTDKGVEVVRYLLGLQLYIKVAEQDRIAMLQSPQAAEKVPEIGDSGDERQRLKLYERVLPYAVLFGQEKEWTKQMGSYYEQVGSRPDWYAGAGAFNAATFASGMSGLSSAASTVSSASSSTGGSSGGGSAGGGGGGGGGGGW